MSCTTRIDGLQNAVAEELHTSVLAKINLTYSQHGNRVFRDLNPARVEVSDVTLVQSAEKPGGLHDWFQQALLSGNSPLRDVHVTYRTGNPPGTQSAFTLNLVGALAYQSIVKNGQVKVAVSQLSLTASAPGQTASTPRAASAAASGANASAASASSATSATTAAAKPTAPSNILPASQRAVPGQTYYANSQKTLAVNVLALAYRGSRFAFNLSEATAGEVLLADNEKFLVTTVRVTNTTITAQPVRYDTFGVKVVDASEATTDSARSLFRAKDQLDAAAQIDAGKSQDFQLITVMSHSERAVRLTLTADDPATTNVFDLRQATIAPLPPELAGGDPANFPDVVTASAGNWYPTGLFDVRFEGLSRSNGPVQGNALAEGDEAAIVKVRVRNGSRGERTVNLTAVLYDDKGQTYGLVLTDDRLIASNPTLGAAKSATAEAGLTLATTVPKKTKIVRVKISEGKGHAFEFKL